MPRFLSQMLGFSKPQNVPSEPTGPGKASDAIVLLSFAKPLASVLSLTPFAGKLEVMLRIADVPYSGLVGDVTNKEHAPKQKFPTLRHGPVVVADSSCIAAYLANTYPSQMAIFTPDDPKRVALAGALQRMLEEHTYFCWLYCLWERDDQWAAFGPVVFADMPPLLRSFVPTLARAHGLRALHEQGVGRHSLETVLQRMGKDLDVCDTLLADTPWLTGETPTAADCYLFALLETTLHGYPPSAKVPSIAAALVNARSNLVSFHARLRSRYFPKGNSEQWEKRFGK